MRNRRAKLDRSGQVTPQDRAVYIEATVLGLRQVDGARIHSILVKMTTRLLLVLHLCTLVLAGCATAPATLRVLSLGTYSVEEVAATASPARTPEEVAIDYHYVRKAALIDPSTKIQRVPQARFGVMYVLEGWGRRQYKCRVVWKYPHPGFLAANGERVLSRELNAVITANRIDGKGFYIGENIDRHPEGQYTLEIFLGEHRVLQQSFELVTPPLAE